MGEVISKTLKREFALSERARRALRVETPEETINVSMNKICITVIHPVFERSHQGHQPVAARKGGA